MKIFYDCMKLACLSFMISMAPLPASAISGGVPIEFVQGSKFGFLRFLQTKTGACTGVRILKDVILTAAHCVIDDNGRVQKVKIKLYKGDPNPINASLAYVHKGYARRVDGKNNWTEYDLAALVFDDERDRDNPYVALTAVEYMWQIYKWRAKKNNQRVWFPDFIDSVDNGSLLQVFHKVLYRHEDGRVSALIAGFGLGDCRREGCSELYGDAKYIGKYIYNGEKGHKWGRCTKESASFLEPKELFCVRSAADETTTPILDRTVTVHDTRGGDSGGPVFVFDRKGNPVLLGITSYGSLLEGYFVNLAAHIDFVKGVTAPYTKDAEVFETYSYYSSPSFDCRTANKLAEKAICDDVMLTIQDNRMALELGRLRHALPRNLQNRLLQEQRAWLRKRDACSNDVDCLDSVYRQRLSELENWR